MNPSFDTSMMARALQLARRGRYSCMPNPHVGCVLARDGQVIGEGYTRPAGGNHAEIEALLSAGEARGATAYVTLEPCSHQGKTGPCADALVTAGVVRVVAAMQDPNPAVSGRGMAKLAAAGIEVQCGLLAQEARALNPGFIARMTRGRGRVRAKLAMSLDGRTAMASGDSQWITGAAARRDVQHLRAESCAILTGIGTVLSDDCALTVRPAELSLSREEAELASRRQPLRVVLDSRLQTPLDARVLRGGGPTMLCHSDAITASAQLQSSAATLLALPSADTGLALAPLFAALTQQQCNEILVESGPRLAGTLLQAGYLDELIVYIAPALMGNRARPLLQLPLDAMAQKVPLTLDEVRRVGEDLRLTVIPGTPESDNHAHDGESE